LKFELEKLLGIKVDLVSKDYLKTRIKKRILKESVRIL
jgi:predicted nucleotidyltransferase